MSSLWTTEVTPVTTGRFDFTGEDALTISSLSLLSGREAIVKLTSEEQDENKPYKIARLTSACPNYSLTVPVLETVTFSIESSDANATVSILGHVNPMDSDDDFDDDDDDEGEADLRKALLAQLGDPESAPELMVEESKPDENDSESGDAEIVQVHQSKEGGMEVEPLTTGTSEVDQSETPEEAESEAPKTPGQKRAMPEPADADSSSKEPKGPGKKAKKTGKKGPQEDSSTPIANPADTATPATAESPEKKKKTPKKSSPEEDKSGSALKRKMLQSGLYYDVQKAGKAGARTSKGKKVDIRYAGYLAKNGHKFDSGRIQFILGANEVVKGMELGCHDMLVDEKRRIFIPSNLGYGKRSIGSIPANSDLIFEVTLLNVS